MSPLRYDSASKTNVSDKTVFTSVPTFPYVQTAQYYSSSSTLLRTVSTTYDNSGLYLPLTVTTTLNDTGQSSSVSYQYYNNQMRNYPTQKQETDFTGAVIRTTKIAYNPSFMKPTSINVYTGSNTNGNPSSSTLFAYDEYSANYCKNSVPMLTNVTGATGHDDAGHGATFTARGNVTTVQRLISGKTYATSHNCYDTLGNLTQTVDANGNPTSFDYSENWTDTNCIPSGTNTHAFPTTVTDALGHQTKQSYFTCTSLLQGKKDPNDIQAARNGTTYTYDEFNRPLSIDYPDGGSDSYSYPNSVTSTDAKAGPGFVETRTLDPFARLQSTVTSDSDCGGGGDTVYFTYDGFGRILSISNPYCSTSDPTYGVTTYAYDALGRTTQVTNPDSTTTLLSYKGRAAQAQDEGNGTNRVTRISQSDALGRLTSVCEVTSVTLPVGSNNTPSSCGLDFPGTGFLTSYQYDALDNLAQVTQAGLNPRSFTYDSLSRLVCASNPENSSAACPATANGSHTPGTVGYTYDANSNLATRTDARGITTTYAYDALNRVVSKNYSDGTAPSYFLYDVAPTNYNAATNAIGRLTAMQATPTFNGWYCPQFIYDYDPMGRITTRNEVADYRCGSYYFNYTYDLMGNPTGETDGYFHWASYGYNSAARLNSVTDSQNAAWQPPNLLSAVKYNALGEIMSDTTAFGETEQYTYTKRGQQQSSTVTFNGTPIYSFNITSFAPNGDVLAVTDSANGIWAYGYDDFNRLTCANLDNGTCASPTNGTRTYTYDYDRYGNRWHQNGPHPMMLAFDANNHVLPGSGFAYDAAGNVIADGVHQYAYDAESRMTYVDAGNTTSFMYDLEGNRGWKNNASGTNTGGGSPDPSGYDDFLHDLHGRVTQTLAPDSGAGWTGEVYAGNRHLAHYNGQESIIHSDWLGTERSHDNVTSDTMRSKPACLSAIGSSPASPKTGPWTSPANGTTSSPTSTTSTPVTMHLPRAASCPQTPLTLVHPSARPNPGTPTPTPSTIPPTSPIHPVSAARDWAPHAPSTAAR